MKDYSNFLIEKPYSCNVEGCSMKFTNEDHLTVHKKRHDMILTLGLGQKGAADQTPTPTQFIRNCEEVGLFQDLQNVNPFEETFKKAVEAVKSGQLSLEKSLQESPSDDTLHTPNIFPHITDVPNVHDTDICNKSENIPPCEELLKQDDCDGDKNDVREIASAPNSIDSVLNEAENKEVMPSNSTNSNKNNFPREKKITVNIPEGHLIQLLAPQNSQSSCNMVFVKNAVGDTLSPLTLAVKEKLKKNLNEKKIGKILTHKVPILKCPMKRPTNSNMNKFSKFSKNAKKLMSKLDISDIKVNEITGLKQKKINKIQSKESRSEFLARSRAASSRCREKKKMYLLYLEKINSELSTANQNLILINSLLRQEISDLRRELVKHKNCNAQNQTAETALTVTSNATTIAEETLPEVEGPSKVRPSSQTGSRIVHDSITSKYDSVHSELFPSEILSCQSDASLFSLDVAEVILNSEPEENEIPLSEGNKPPDIIVRFNSVSNDVPAALPFDHCIDQYVERAGETVKQIYGEHSYYLKKPLIDIDRRLMNYKTLRGDGDTEIGSEECKKLGALQIKIQQNESLGDLASLNSRVLIGPRTPPPLILLKPFKKRSLQSKRNEKT